MAIATLQSRNATLVRVIGLGLIGWSVAGSGQGMGFHGRLLLVTIAFACAVVAWVYWTYQAVRPDWDRGVSLDLFVLAAAGGVLCQAAPSAAGSAFAFVAIVAAGVRAPLGRAFMVAAVGALGLLIGELAYDGSALGALAYCLGFGGAVLGGAAAREGRLRADQAELLLAQTQRSTEEQLRAARLEESTRIAREIHDVLAHTLAGLTIQLEATAALVENGAGRDDILTRVRRAHELAREGLVETRRAVGALRGDGPSVPEAIRGLAASYRSSEARAASLTLDGDLSRLTGDVGQVVLRVVQEAVTNITKHAPGAAVSIAVHAGPEATEAVIDNAAVKVPVAAGALASSGGGYGLQGMRERSTAVGGTVEAGPTVDGWRVVLHIPVGGGGL